ncbi:hypothetical protein ACQ86N_41205 [Puia sp. P3]|uniref:hypothetical protein n=1 Tax=Puia sp. P3 TaxID=3423952 RepID=UPI003D668A53
MSQGFKVELNDMNGKLKTEATYSETDSVHPLSYTANYYKVDNQNVEFKHLNNTVAAIDPQGNIDGNASIGKDAELMTDMREHVSNGTGANINVNVDVFMAGIWPLALPDLLNLYQHETTQFRSVALTKIIQRYGILDSVVHIDKGSKISSKNLLYDGETGDPILVRTQNEFDDSLFQFTYPSHWAYKGAGPAYQNIGVRFDHLRIDKGRITSSLGGPASSFFTPGDELLVNSRVTVIPNCDTTKIVPESFPDSYQLWVVDSIPSNGGTPVPYIVDQFGTPFSGNDVSLKVVRSGYRNIGGSVGAITSLDNPMVPGGVGGYHLVLDSSRRVITASAAEMQQQWRVSDKRRSNVLSACVYTPQDSALAATEGCTCLQPFFAYLISSHKLYSSYLFPHETVGSLAAEAGIDVNSCTILKNNASMTFHVMTPNPNGTVYMAAIGKDIVSIQNVSGMPLNLYSMTSYCDGQGNVRFRTPGAIIPGPDTVTLNISPDSYVNLISSIGTSCPSYVDSLLQTDSLSDQLLVENSLNVGGISRNASPVLNFGRLDRILPGDSVLSAKLILHADQRGHLPPQYSNANSTNPQDSIGISLSQPAGWFPHQPLDTMLYQAYYTPFFSGAANTTAFQDLSLDLTNYVNGYIHGSYASTAFVLAQGAGGMHSTFGFDSAMIAAQAVPPYLAGGVGNYYATYYSPRYTDSTKRPVLQVKYLRYHGGDTSGALLAFNSTVNCTTVYGRSCYSAITDTLVNPFKYGITGNYRPQRSYVYYGRRKETDPNATVDIRTAGVINSFAPFWTLSSGVWSPSYDTTRWVWNSQTTLFNRKGFELENKDPWAATTPVSMDMGLPCLRR